jgi:hypothetical protein
MGDKVSPTRHHHVTSQKDHNINNHCHRNLNIYIIRLLSCLSYRMPMRKLGTSTKDVLYSLIQQIFCRVHILHS